MGGALQALREQLFPMLRERQQAGAEVTVRAVLARPMLRGGVDMRCVAGSVRTFSVCCVVRRPITTATTTTTTTTTTITTATTATTTRVLPSVVDHDWCSTRVQRKARVCLPQQAHEYCAHAATSRKKRSNHRVVSDR